MCTCDPQGEAARHVQVRPATSLLIQLQRLAQEQMSRAEAGQPEARWQAILDVLPVGVFLADARGHIVHTNAAARRIWGEDASLVAETAQYPAYQGWWVRTGRAIGADEWAFPTAIRRGDTIADQEIIIHTFGGQRKTILYSAAPIWHETGAIAGGVATMLDITERKQLEEERAELLTRAQEAHAEVSAAMRIRHELLHAASHDLGAPLTVLAGTVELMGWRLDGDRPVDAAWLGARLATLNAAITRMRSMVQEIADAAMLQAGQPLMLTMAPVDVGAVVYEIAELVSHAGARAIPVHVAVPGDAVMVRGDRARLERVVQNVVGNAVKYSAQRGPVEVTVCTDGAQVAITVRDSGVGIPVDELPRIFTPFYRASNAIGIAGTGIGLAGSKAIVEQHGGRITVESVAGQGTAVTITLPCQLDQSSLLPKNTSNSVDF